MQFFRISTYIFLIIVCASQKKRSRRSIVSTIIFLAKFVPTSPRSEQALARFVTKKKQRHVLTSPLKAVLSL